MSHSIIIIGNGMLADTVSEQLSGLYSITRWATVKEAVPNQGNLALVLHDSWVPAEHLEADEAFSFFGIPWLRGFVSFGEANIGPLVLPDKQGCSQCADRRRFMAGSDRREQFQMKEYKMDQPGIEQDPWASASGLLQTSYLIQEEVHRLLKGEKARTYEHVFLLQLNTLRLSYHFFLPDPYCPVCGDLPEDTADTAEIILKQSPKTSIDSYRCRSLEDMEKVLGKDYLDSRTGLLNHKRYDFISPFADTIVNLPLLSGDELTGGRTHSYAQSEQSAILEGLERYCGYAPMGKRTMVYGPYSKVEKHALNPRSIGLHTKEQYDMPGFPFKPLDSERPIHWVWGYSLSQNRPILVPETFAYYSLGGGEGFVYETSNGCALGGSMEEAILYGIFEIVERDSFLMTWYGQLPIPRLDLSSIDDRELQLMIQRIHAVTGYEVHLFNSTTENGIPSIWALAKNTKQTGMNLLCAAGAHIDPLRAVKGAVQELSGMLLTMDDKLEKEREKYRQMYDDSLLVHHMEDHSMLYGLKEAEERLFFLLDQRPKRSFQQEFHPVHKSADLLDDVVEILEVFRQLQLEVIVVDQTSPELKRNGLHCVKVVIPGMLPMTFGHHLTRLKGLDRVLNIPAKLGYTREPLTYSSLNPYPHPFP
ncbi:TOMM precursor leader peptide-binding protein [Fictibacillus sp. WQ 8-8]|uniref:TOMM precursor leader peptide-binding protein n=1 Tax=Fictibacillus sp. WQ 8-8 TaxID=2938788 RepID=UPI00210D3E39|nr:TOMM precursor leader peptide-binding protein [Fictibacillus sp. WQ 8-8]MCQ6268196.1 TOMM precursor leader peptide-binding protein [Fictibacillus sp. WQ 8-8]